MVVGYVTPLLTIINHSSSEATTAPHTAPLQVTHRPAFRAGRQELRPVLGARRLADVKPVAAQAHRGWNR